MGKKNLMIAVFLCSISCLIGGSCNYFQDSEAERLRAELEELKKEQKKDESAKEVRKLVKVSSGYLSLRDAPDAKSGKLVARIPDGAEISIEECRDEVIEIGGREGRWCKTNYEGKTGWVFDAYLAAPTKENKAAVRTREVLWDFRESEAEANQLSKEETTKVLTFLFGDTWDEELSVTGKVSGSFTKPDAEELLYYVGGCDEGGGFKDTSNCSHSMSWNAGRIAIFENDAPVMKLEGALGYAIGKVTDVNGDAINEIVSLNGFTNQGATERSIRFGRVKGGKYEKVLLKGIQAPDHNFYPGYSDGCASGFKEAQIRKAAVISYVPSADGTLPTFSEEFFQSGCKDSKWKKISREAFRN